MCVLVAAVFAVVVIEVVALTNGIDGALLLASFALIGAIVGLPIPLDKFINLKK